MRERRTPPFSSLDGLDEPGRPSVEPERFLPAGHRWAGHWASPPRSWGDVPEERLLSAETRAEVERAVELLAPAQRAVITLRDVEGMTAAETCELLGLTEGNQRVLLHRARSRVRRALERYLDETEVRPMTDPTTDDLECREVVEVVTDYLEGALAPDDRLRFDDHLAALRGLPGLPGADADRRPGGRPADGGRRGPAGDDGRAPASVPGLAALAGREGPGSRPGRPAPRTSTVVGITAGEPASTSRPITTGSTTPPRLAAANTVAVDPRAPGAAWASQASAVGNTGPRARPVRV